MAGPTYGAQGTVQAMSLAISIFDQVASDFMDVLYPEHDWRKVLAKEQILTDINAGAQNYVQMVRDQRGAAAYQSNIRGNNIPLVGLSMGAITIPLAASAVGSRITNEDARQYDFGFKSTLTKDLAEVMQQAEENLIEGSFFFGDATVGFLSWLSYTGLTTLTAAAGAKALTAWSSKTGAEMVTDVVTAQTYQYVNSRTLFLSGELYLPPTQFGIMASTPMVIGSTPVAMTALEFLKKNNLYTSITGKELKVQVVRYLQGAGAAGSDRMVLNVGGRKNMAMPMPLPYTLQAPIPVPLGAAYFAEMKHGSVAIFQPLSMLYVDGI